MYTIYIVCSRYIILNTLHKGDNKANNNNYYYYYLFIYLFIYLLTQKPNDELQNHF